MNPTDTRIHQETWGLLPWLANGRADTVQRRRAQAHLADCADCRAELAREQYLAAAMAQPSVPGPDLSQGLARLMQRLDQATPARPSRPWLAIGTGRGATIRLSTAALLGALQLALFAAAAAWWLHTSAPAAGSASGYQTLTQAPSSTPPAGPGLRVVFHGGRPISELQALLVGHGLVIVSGPTEAGVFTLRPAATRPMRDIDALAAELRRSPTVAFAEPTGPASAQ
ncbi:MAG TPA: zf-HC2 domain-containing protein [Ideonella sp.]|uniref:anti-sigma factor family protein n=1 Tax=Ideonella sp. TaxID=1929293 RepID=UPI002E2ED5CC|nr:zf-HC2 domain-containing protein [Ideonella sp.]HEX5683183.1 zf-HC2 domain-containing protein [Ideonella sp.]